MKQTPLHRLEQLEQQKARAGCGIISRSEFSPGGWTTFFRGRCRDFDTLEAAEQFLTDKGLDPLIVVDV